MKLLRSFLVAVALVASISSVQAHDSFRIGINIGGFAPYAYPAVGYHLAPPVVYHSPRISHAAPIIVHPGVHYGGSRHYHPAPRPHAFHGHHGGHRHFNRGHGFNYGHGHRGHGHR